jgi:hypothetical protein
MVRFLLVVGLIGGAGFLMMNYVSSNPLETRYENGQLVVRSDPVEARFYRVGPVQDSYMMFGALVSDKQGFVANVVISTIAQAQVSALAQRYPDFDRCSSPGASEAKSMVQSMNLIAASGSVRRVLVKAVKLHDERINESGERTCISLEGEELTMTSAHLWEHDMDVTQEYSQRDAMNGFYLVNEASIVDCSAILQ